MDIVSRLKYFMDTEQITISQFADNCKIPRPTMSQILNGRNKKISDELISKIHASYPMLSILWLMFGEGDMVINENFQFSERQNAPDQRHGDPQYANNEQLNLFGNKENATAEFSAEKYSGATRATSPYPLPGEGPSFIDFGTFNPEMTTTDARTKATGENEQMHQQTPTTTTTTKEEQQTDCTPQNQAAPTQRDADPTAWLAPKAGVNINDTSTTKHIELSTPSNKTITNIVVFYSDNSFQSFSPTAI